MNQFFDLHCHSASKTYLTAINMAEKKNPWEKVRGGVLQIVAPILTSQASFNQALEGNVRILVASIVPLEKGYTRFWLIKDIVTEATALSREFIEAIDNQEFSFFDLLRDEINFIILNKEFGGKRLNFLKSSEDLVDDPNTINVLFNIEGSHALSSYKRGHHEHNYLENLIEIKKRSDFNCFYLTFTHLNKISVCNHAYGAKITKDNIFKPSKIYTGVGVEGFEIIDECYSTENGPRILLDIKHMSVVARKEFYSYRRQQGYNHIPILASHVGVTGFPLAHLGQMVDKEREPRRKKRRGYVKVRYKTLMGIGQGKENETCFNPWFINLYDEEILEIMKSGGLIGLILDQRVLGYDKVKPEFFAKDEWNILNGQDFELVPNSPTGPLLASIGTVLDDTEEDEEDDFELMGEVNPQAMINAEDVTDEMMERDVVVDQFEDTDLTRKKRRHLRILCNNILHIVKVGGEEAWKHICMGSDFDGLINPINNCKRISEYPQLENNLQSELESMIQEAEHDPKLSVGSVPSDLAQKVRGIMFENGKRFLEEHFSAQAIGMKP